MKRATLLMAILFGMPTFAFAQRGYHLFRPGNWETRLGMEYRVTDANYESGGGQTSLRDGGKLTLIDFDFSSRYVLGSDWALFGQLNMTHGESIGADATRSGLILTSGQLGVEWNTGIFDFLDFIPQFSYLIPFEKINADQDDLITSEGVDEIFLNFHLQAAFESFRLYGGLGYMARGEGRSSLMPWSVGTEVPLTSFLVGVRLNGFESVSDDQDAGSITDEDARVNTVDRVNAGSFKFYSVNPSIVSTEVYSTFGIGKNIVLGLHGGLTLAGTNSASEIFAGSTLSYRFNPTPVARTRPPVENRISIDPQVDQFREDTNDGVNQNLFKPAPRRIRMAPAPPPRPKAVPKKKKSESDEMKRLRKQLNEAEMTIELKADPNYKKKRR